MARTHTRRFPTPIQHDGRAYLTTAQVAKLLGVKPATVYAYVSRGRMSSARIDGIDGSVFPVDEIEALVDGRPRRTPAGVVERIQTELTLLADDRLYYRGRDAVTLAETASFEEVAALLWNVETDWPAAALDDDAIEAIRAAAGGRARGVDLVRMTVDVLGARDALRYQVDPAAVAVKVAALIGGCLQVLAAGEPGSGAVADRLWPCLTEESPAPRKIKVLNAALVLLADHDLSVGTVAARVAASSRGSVYAVIGAGLGAFDGPTHGGATTLAYRFLRDAIDDPDVAVAAVLHAGNRIPGTGHVVYRDRDPRAEYLLGIIAGSGGDPRVGQALDRIRQHLPESSFLNSDFALAALALQHSMRADAAETVFALARIVGWTAHALEEYGARALRFRPEGVYTGVRPGSSASAAQ
ncbi:citrate synthase [Gordonia sp. CPCC 205515]|uniref:citrate synthase n=1 Tax=Gordonia sp. CPCC 205515 TaxID=3140791 RepID=UPI003AF38541